MCSRVVASDAVQHREPHRNRNAHRVISKRVSASGYLRMNGMSAAVGGWAPAATAKPTPQKQGL
jgi:hypothetical protein